MGDRGRRLDDDRRDAARHRRRRGSDEKQFPANGCEDVDASVLFRQQLWVLCGEEGYVFERDSRDPVRTFAAPSARTLLAGTTTVWGVGDTALTGLAGESPGARIPIPAEFEPWPEGEVAWTIEGDEAWAQGSVHDGAALLRVDLRRRDTHVAPIRSEVPGELAIVGDELWLAQSGDAAIDRYSRTNPGTRLGRLRVPASDVQELTFNDIASASGSAWVSVTGDETRLFRIRRS